MPQPTPLREHILCVDDEEGILAALRQQLSARFGGECDIAVAKNAREALDLIEDLQQDGEQLAVVIADQIMPGMKGVELLEEVHRRSPQTVKILLTGQAGLDAVVYAINRPASISTSRSRGTSPICGSRSRTCCRASASSASAPSC